MLQLPVKAELSTTHWLAFSGSAPVPSPPPVILIMVVVSGVAPVPSLPPAMQFTDDESGTAPVPSEPPAIQFKPVKIKKK